MNLGGISKAMFGSGIVCRLSYEKVENANKMYRETGVHGMLLYSSHAHVSTGFCCIMRRFSGTCVQ